MNIWNSPHRWILLLALAVVILVIAGNASFILRFQRASTPTPPSAFYMPPDVLPAVEPGTIIRSEPLPDGLPEGAQAYRVMYLSSGLNGEPIAVTGTVVAPAGESDTPRPVIAWAHGTTGIFPECGVSHTRDPYQQTPVIERMVDSGQIRDDPARSELARCNRRSASSEGRCCRTGVA